MSLHLLRPMIKGLGRRRKKTVWKKCAPKKSAEHGRRGGIFLVGKKTE
jgi:hypothetical protein